MEGYGYISSLVGKVAMELVGFAKKRRNFDPDKIGLEVDKSLHFTGSS